MMSATLYCARRWRPRGLRGVLVVAAWTLAQALAGAEVRTVAIDSSSNGRSLTFAVYLPPNYDGEATRRYPVVYSLHGLSGHPQRRVGQMVPALDAAIKAGTVLPMIFVFPDGQSNSFYGDAFDRHKMAYSHIIHEVVPYVDRHFRTKSERAFRAIEGFSMGGYGAALLGAKHPELFGAVVVYAGAFAEWGSFHPGSRREMYNDNEDHFLPFSVWEVTRRHSQQLRDSVAYLVVVGDDDQEFQSTTRFHDFLDGLGVPHEFVVLPGFGHNGRAYADEGMGARFLSRHFDKAAVKK